jgi:N-acetylglucosamine-6-phosphate deacetylase
MGATSPTTPSSIISNEDLQTCNNSRIIRFINASLCDGGVLYPNSELWVDSGSGLILDGDTLSSSSSSSSSGFTTIDLHGDIIAPGFIDAQLNGGFGMDFSDIAYGDGSCKAFEDGLAYVSKQILKTGVTSFCPTLPSTYPHVYRKVLPSLRARRTAEGAESLGFHLEGPFLSPKKLGCHPRDAFRTAPNHIESFKEVYGQENIADAAIITVAAEQEGVMESIPALVDMGIVVSLGHSVLDYDGGCKAISLGATMVTHVYNAMTQPHHREPGLFGLMGAPVNDIHSTKPFFGIIADGIHVHRSGVSVAYHAHAEGCCLVTDAMFPMGLPSGTYAWGDQSIVKDDLKLYLNGTSTIAGSAVELDTSLRNLMHWAEIPLEKAVETVTTHPARVLGVLGTKGTLKPNADADLTVLDPQGYVKQVYKLGRCVYKAPVQKISELKLDDKN